MVLLTPLWRSSSDDREYVLRKKETASTSSPFFVQERHELGRWLGSVFRSFA
ncbi:hypothetical protein [Paenarthrobacter sp. PH39-S1]|uniref:hypothetical protein n=1 Tax=Paenarthrobacter sp. PH39-S1 TaxID=3046204 RepID=UPI0024BBB01A|nr:hypothetical protein [Paenarthrobacter sp. PH39-S1]MDJ0358200.1 hypothetical protein [Paenarthrobacter sp. PH39-S1]